MIVKYNDDMQKNIRMLTHMNMITNGIVSVLSMSRQKELVIFASGKAPMNTIITNTNPQTIPMAITLCMVLNPNF